MTPQRTTTSSDSWNAGALASSALLTSAVATIVVIGFLGSYGPLRDAFLAIHQSPAAASRDPRAVDGLIAVATAAVIWLKNNKAAHRYAVSVGAAIPLLLNFLHGCGVIRAEGLTSSPIHPLLVLITRTSPYPLRDSTPSRSSRRNRACIGPRTGPVPPAHPRHSSRKKWESENGKASAVWTYLRAGGRPESADRTAPIPSDKLVRQAHAQSGTVPSAQFRNSASSDVSPDLVRLPSVLVGRATALWVGLAALAATVGRP